MKIKNLLLSFCLIISLISHAFAQGAMTYPVNGSNGGSGVNNGTNTLTLGGSVAYIGSNPVTWTTTGSTALTLPTSGTLTALGNTVTGSGGTLVEGNSPTIVTPIFTTNATDPLIIGGTGTGSTLTLESTSGIGATDAIAFKTGSQVATMQLSTGGGLSIGSSYAATAAPNGGMIAIGSVGIGTASPTGALDVRGNIVLGNNNAYIQGKSNGGTLYQILGVNTSNQDQYISAGGGFKWVNAAVNTVLMIMGDSGGLAIGSSAAIGSGLTLGAASTHAGQAACFTTGGQMGYCTSVVGAGGGCTCTGI